MPDRPTPHPLLDHDAGFAHAVPGADRKAARDLLVVPAIAVEPGSWTPPSDARRSLALLVVHGLAIRGARGGRTGLSLLEPGDLTDPHGVTDDRWVILRPTLIAMLDARFVAAARRWPRLWLALTRRLFDTAHRRGALDGILALPRAETRVLALLETLGRRIGTVTPAGVLLDAPLTHKVIGELVGAERPTVSLAMTSLVARGSIVRGDHGGWIVPATPREAGDEVAVGERSGVAV